jgi:hypothetical protein
MLTNCVISGNIESLRDGESGVHGANSRNAMRTPMRFGKSASGGVVNNPMVDPALLARLRNLKGCGGNFGPDTLQHGDPAIDWASECDACLTLLVQAIGAAVEEQAIERHLAAFRGAEFGEARQILRALPRQWGRKDREG